jgi:hypothetical protein
MVLDAIAANAPLVARGVGALAPLNRVLFLAFHAVTSIERCVMNKGSTAASEAATRGPLRPLPVGRPRKRKVDNKRGQE